MADANRYGHAHLPAGLLESLAFRPSEPTCLERVEVARQHAHRRAFDEPVVVREIATQLLALSSR